MTKDNWTPTILRDLVDVRHGFAFQGESFTDEETRDILLTPGNFAIGGGYKGDKLKYYLGEVPEDYVLSHHDLIVTMTDLSKNIDTLGYSALVPEEPGKRFLHNQRLGKVIIRDEKRIDKYFLFYLLRTDDYRNEVKASASGSVIRHTSPDRIRNYKFLLPTLPEQRAIAEILGALDDKIELNRRMNATLEGMARAMFRRWFVESKEIEGWEESSLEGIFGKKSDCVLTGPFGSHLHAHDYREEGTPLILVKHVIDGHILEDGLPLVGAHKLPDMKRYTLEVGDIVFTRVGAVGRSAYVHPRNKGWLISGQTLRVRVLDKTKLNPRYLAQIYLEPSFIGMVEQHALGTTRPSLNTTILSSFKFVLPPIELQNRFGEFAEAIDNKVQHNLHESRTLANLRDTLLPKLMRGEVRAKK